MQSIAVLIPMTTNNCRTELAAHEAPNSFIFAEDQAKSPAGKILHRQLRKQ